MWKQAAKVGFLLFAVAGCKSPQIVLHQLQQSDPCLNSTSQINASVETTAESVSIEEYVQLGLARNPQIAAAQHRIDAIRHRIPQALSLPDPMVNTTTYLAPVQTAAGEQSFALGISQKFVDVERRATKAAIVSHEVVAAKAAFAQLQLEVAANIRTACFQLLFVRKSIEITQEDREKLEQIEEVVRNQYEVKKTVTQQDVLNIQIEQSKIENQLSELRQKEKSFQARLARLLHVDPKSDLQIADQLETVGTLLDVDVLIAQAIQSRPDLQSQLANVRGDRNKVHLAYLEERPDFTVGLNWIATSSSGISPVANGDDALLLGVGFNWPIYKSRIRAGICEAQSSRLASESQLTGLYDSASEEVFDLVAKLDSTREMLTLIQEDILPKAERTLEVSIDEYRTDSISFVQLIANWRNVFRYRITESDLQSQHNQLLASLARSVGQLVPISSSWPISPTGNDSALQTDWIENVPADSNAESEN